MSTWYLGPLGDLRPLICPDPDITINEVRYGGIHQGLSGARTMDVTGHRSEYAFNFGFLDQEEYSWLENLHTRMVAGPHWLINPLKKNRLSLQASRLVVNPYGKAGVRLPVGSDYNPSAGFPTSFVGVAGRSVYVWHWTDQSPRITFDPGRYIPILPGERMSGSVYLSASGGTVSNMSLRFEWFGPTGDPVNGSPSSTSDTFSLTSTWGPQTFSDVAPPSGAAACRFSIGIGSLSDPDTAIFFAAPQVEAGASRTDFEVGSAAPEVLIDQVETTSPRYPYRNVSLKLLEA